MPFPVSLRRSGLAVPLFVLPHVVLAHVCLAALPFSMVALLGGPRRMLWVCVALFVLALVPLPDRIVARLLPRLMRRAVRRRHLACVSSLNGPEMVRTVGAVDPPYHAYTELADVVRTEAALLAFQELPGLPQHLPKALAEHRCSTERTRNRLPLGAVLPHPSMSARIPDELAQHQHLLRYLRVPAGAAIVELSAYTRTLDADRLALALRLAVDNPHDLWPDSNVTGPGAGLVLPLAPLTDLLDTLAGLDAAAFAVFARLAQDPTSRTSSLRDLLSVARGVAA